MQLVCREWAAVAVQAKLLVRPRTSKAYAAEFGALRMTPTLLPRVLAWDNGVYQGSAHYSWAPRPSVMPLPNRQMCRPSAPY